jgi:hypothetical protein
MDSRSKKGAEFIVKFGGYSVYYKNRYATTDAEMFVGWKNGQQIQISPNLKGLFEDIIGNK